MMYAESLILTYLSNDDLHPQIWIEPGLPWGVTPLPRPQRNRPSAKDIHYIVGYRVVNQQPFAGVMKVGTWYLPTSKALLGRGPRINHTTRSNVRNANISEL